MDPIIIYHELQDSALCGQHCLNNLLQDDFFTAVHLAEIAQELDDQERSIIDEGISPGKSANVDESGNFSIQVLRLALQRYNNVDLDPWHDGSDPLEQQGFVVNRSDHWFTIRQINGKWWNLNSTEEKPVLISGFFLSATLAQLRQDEYSVFIAKGNLPECEQMGESGKGGRWYTEKQLLGGGAGAAAVSVFSGVGNRLGGDTGAVNMADFRIDGEEDDEDFLMAQAISASMAASASTSTGDAKKDAAAEMREKRLAALEKRGL
mmetsp:Transcript_10165/g.22169  ORF Transcript_10165/g.22169 Transcript_10165/m.22169 type:complete len:264 (+) Transcript_10165:101-892(+)